jgi:hypothetical protein
VRIRRALGLLTFGYAALHLATYAGVDQFFDWAAIGADIAKRKFIAVGFATFLLLAPLAVTSTDGWVRRLGFRRWKALHRLVYAAALGGVIHFLWRVKIDLREPLFFAIAIGLLVLLRLVPRPARPRRAPAAAGPGAAAGPPLPPTPCRPGGLPQARRDSRLTVARRSSSVTGFCRTAATESPCAFRSTPVSADITTTGIPDSRGSRASSARSCQPSMTGIIRSMRITLGALAWCSRSSASRPLLAGMTR